MQRLLSRSSLVPVGFIVESAFCDEDKTTTTVRWSRSFSLCLSYGTASQRVHRRLLYK
jgi:hypothetical protein